MSVFRAPILILLLLVFGSCCFAQINIQLSPESQKAFDDYIKTAESQMNWQARFPAQAKPGELTITASGAQSPVDAPGALIHDWTAAMLVSSGTAEKALKVMQSYNDYKTIYAPQVTDSKLLERNGDNFRVYLKLNKSKGLISVVLNSEYDVNYKPLGTNRWSKLSRSTKVSEIQFGKEQPVGTGVGFLWRLNAYWIIEPRPNGVYLECRTISMSRDIPPGMGWMIKPMVTSLPRESLRDTMNATASAILRTK